MIRKLNFIVLALLGVALSTTSCSSGEKKTMKVSDKGPSVVNAHSEPGVVVLNRDMQPNQSAAVVADVKDFNNPIVEVRLKFQDVPLNVPMENIGGTTWRAQLSPQQLQMLAVSGKTMGYKAQIVARNNAGDTATSAEPINVAVRAPDVATTG